MTDILLDEFPFATLWNGGILFFVFLGLVLNFFIIPKARDNAVLKAIAIVLGMIILFITLGSPLNILGRLEFSLHVLQLILMTLVAAPLIVIGFKFRELDFLLKIKPIDRIVSLMVNPILTIGLFYSLFYVYHIPTVFNTIRTDLYLNYFYMFGLFIASMLLWIPLVYDKKLISNKKLKYIFVNVIGLLIFSIIMIISKNNLYEVYTNPDFFAKALELCFPQNIEIDPEIYLELIQYEPVIQQKQGGFMLIFSTVIIFGISLFTIKRREIIKK